MKLELLLLLLLLLLLPLVSLLLSQLHHEWQQQKQQLQFHFSSFICSKFFISFESIRGDWPRTIDSVASSVATSKTKKWWDPMTATESIGRSARKGARKGAFSKQL